MRTIKADLTRYTIEFDPSTLEMWFYGTPLGDLLVRYPSHWHVLEASWQAFHETESDACRAFHQQILKHYGVQCS